MAKAKLVVGLGNVGERYDRTRHNAGFLAVERFVKLHEGSFSHKKDLLSNISILDLREDLRVYVVKPITLMNLSGQAVSLTQRFYKIDSEDVLVVYDDKDIEFGAHKSQPGGRGSAGHNGIKSLPETVQKSAQRLRIGVSNELLEHIDTADFVLKPFSRDEIVRLETELLGRYADEIEQFCLDEAKSS